MYVSRQDWGRAGWGGPGPQGRCLVPEDGNQKVGPGLAGFQAGHYRCFERLHTPSTMSTTNKASILLLLLLPLSLTRRQQRWRRRRWRRGGLVRRVRSWRGPDIPPRAGGYHTPTLSHVIMQKFAFFCASLEQRLQTWQHVSITAQGYGHREPVKS